MLLPYPNPSWSEPVEVSNNFYQKACKDPAKGMGHDRTVGMHTNKHAHPPNPINKLRLPLKAVESS